MNSSDNTQVPVMILSLSKSKKGLLSKIKTDNLFKLIFPKVATMAMNFVRIGPRVILRSAFQLLRTNIWTRLVSTILLLFFDCYAFFKKRISRKQFFINLVLSLSLLIGGTVGWTMGTWGSLLIVAENTVLFIICGLVGAGVLSAVFDKMSKLIISTFLSSDVDDMLRVMNEVFLEMANEYELTYEQTCLIAKRVEIDEKMCVTCFTKSNKNKYTREILQSYFLEFEDTSSTMHLTEVDVL